MNLVTVIGPLNGELLTHETLVNPDGSSDSDLKSGKTQPSLGADKHTEAESEVLFALGVVFSRKWRLQILAALVDGPVRLSDLRRRIPPISKKVLLQSLRSLEEIGWVDRRDFSTKTRWVEYAVAAEHIELLRQVLKARL